MTRYATHPMEDSFIDWDSRRIANRDAYWRALRTASSDYIKLTENCVEADTGANGFYYYLQHNYGFKPELIDGKYSDTYTVTEPKKFMLFQLQYWQ